MDLLIKIGTVIALVVAYIIVYNAILKVLPNPLKKPFKVIVCFAWFIYAALHHDVFLGCFWAFMTIVEFTSKSTPKPAPPTEPENV